MSCVPKRPPNADKIGEALVDLGRGFVEPALLCADDWSATPPDQLPAPFHKLLVHHDHMTTVLAARYGRPVALSVLRQRIDGDRYHRQIVLRPVGSTTIVECGLVRINLAFVSDPVRKAIVEQREPLGDILIQHDVLRRIEPRWYARFRGSGSLLSSFGGRLSHDAFGRIGTIYCDRSPAIELLEIVTGDDA